MNEEMRKEFEAWLVEYCNKINYAMKDKATKRNGVYYALMWVDGAWIGWQASREAMKLIKLPKETDTSTCKSIEKEILHDGINYGIQQCKEAIQQAGYKVEE